MKYQTLFAAALVLSSSAFAASFDCAKAGTPIEMLICQDEQLNKLDEALGKNYSYLLKSTSDDAEKKDIKDRQRSWVTDRNKCADVSCLVGAYKDRLDDMCPSTAKFGKDPDCLDFNDATVPQQAKQVTQPPAAPLATAATSPDQQALRVIKEPEPELRQAAPSQREKERTTLIYGSIAGFLIFLATFGITWKLSALFLSISDYVVKSPIAILKARLGAAATMSFMAGYGAFWLVAWLIN